METESVEMGENGVSIGDLNLLILLYADDTVLFSESKEDLQRSLDLLHDYCVRWRLMVKYRKN